MYPARRASHAGSWYSASRDTLTGQLDGWLDAASACSDSSWMLTQPLRAIIAPHAGYAYSGATAGYAYARVLRDTASPAPRLIVILGPSHHVHLDGCAVSGAHTLCTPTGDLPVATDAAAALVSSRSGLFRYMTREEDEDEHSIEMQLPMLSRVLARTSASDATVLPIMIGAISSRVESDVARALAPLLADPATLCIVSSDFCHWGTRFGYTYVHPTPGGAAPIHAAIRTLDHDGMRLIEAKDTSGFAAYLSRTRNTICGRHPIGVLLAVMDVLRAPWRVTFIAYAQSSEVTTKADSSVSYASAVVAVEDTTTTAAAAAASGGASGSSARR